MRFVRIEVDLDSLLREIEHREKVLDSEPRMTGLFGSAMKREMRLVMSQKTAKAFCQVYDAFVTNGGYIPHVLTTDSRIYDIRGHRVDLNDGLELGEVLFTEVMP